MTKPAVAFGLALCITSVSCSSSKNFVANAAAAYTYYEARYEQLCVEAKLAGNCEVQQQNLKALKRDIELANTVQKIGSMPKQQQQELKAGVDKAARWNKSS